VYNNLALSDMVCIIKSVRQRNTNPKDTMMTQAQDFLNAHGTDAATVMTALDAAEIAAKQDWQNESTTWTFDDDSIIVVSGNDVTAESPTTVCGHQIQYDKSGVGHCWASIDRDEIPASIVEEIEGEILDGKLDTCDDFIGSDGVHYRW
jgi:hypothetical protein